MLSQNLPIGQSNKAEISQGKRLSPGVCFVSFLNKGEADFYENSLVFMGRRDSRARHIKAMS